MSCCFFSNYPPQHHQLQGVLKRGPFVRPSVRPSVRIPVRLISSKLFVTFSSNLVHSCRLPWRCVMHKNYANWKSIFVILGLKSKKYKENCNISCPGRNFLYVCQNDFKFQTTVHIDWHQWNMQRLFRQYVFQDNNYLTLDNELLRGILLTVFACYFWVRSDLRPLS